MKLQITDEEATAELLRWTTTLKDAEVYKACVETDDLKQLKREGKKIYAEYKTGEIVLMSEEKTEEDARKMIRGIFQVARLFKEEYQPKTKKTETKNAGNQSDSDGK